jgi:hypothetical protein
MNQLTPDQLSQALALAGKIQQGIRERPDAMQKLRRSRVGEHLELAEARLRQVYESRGRAPAGNLNIATEFGLALYRINNDFPNLARLLNRAKLLPKSKISRREFGEMSEFFRSSVIVSDEGEIWGFSKYEQLDAGWTLSLLNYFLTRIFGKSHFRHTPAHIPATGKKSVSLALVGDWGTGIWDDHGCICPSAMIALQLQSLNPDYAIHLGDVYYSGTTGEERENLEDVWFRDFGTNLALNSNHEMYSGAKGYFRVLEEKNGKFSSQQGTSYFCIELDDWIILGLDSAYYADNFLCQNGVLSDDDENQIKFIQSLPLSKKRLVVLTHHNGLSLDGKTQTKLWADVTKKIGVSPDFWYWGHLHNGVAYSSKAKSGTTKARCVGHGALPFGKASALLAGDEPIDTVVYFSHEPSPDQQDRVQNGFALLSFSAAGMTEKFYNQSGKVEWSKTWTSSSMRRAKRG